MIKKDNYEAYFLDYLEGNLSEKDKKELELFLKENPKLGEELKAYDNSLFLFPDMEISFKEKESLRHNKAFLFPLWVKYSSVAAVFILICLVSGKLFFQTLPEKELPISSPIASNIKQPIIEEKEKKTERKSEKEILKENITKSIIQNQDSKSIAKVEKQIDSNNNFTVKEPKVIISNNLIAYEVNNLIAFEQNNEVEEKNIIEVNNLIVYKENDNYLLSPLINNKYVYNLRNNIEGKIDETKKDFNNALAYIQDNIKFNPFGINITKK